MEQNVENIRGVKIERLEDAYLIDNDKKNDPYPPTPHDSHTLLKVKGWTARKVKTHKTHQAGMSFNTNEEKGTTLAMGVDNGYK